jgi:hypothetical protein
VPTEGAAYRERTRRNVEAADATLIVARGPLAGGTALTESYCRELGRPHLVVDVLDGGAVDAAAAWLARVRPRVLNVAGPRESTHRGIGEQAYALLARVLGAE